MSIFSEIYGTYFRITSEVLSKGRLSENEVRDIAAKKGFSDTILFIPEKLIPDKSGNSPWNLLSRNPDNTLSSVLKNKPLNLITTLQKRWLKSILSDRRISLFLDETSFEKLSEKLADIKPLYDETLFRTFDAAADGDDYSDTEYRKYFRTIIKSIKEQRLLEIAFNSPKRDLMTGVYLPLKMEYSTKNDKFRVLCVKFQNDKPCCKATVNMGRITSVKTLDTVYSKYVDMVRYHAETRCKTPVTVVVSEERNGIERFMTSFATYEKQSVYNPDTKQCNVKLWYDRQDETELLIQLLSFGPVLEIISPQSFRKQAEERVKRQYSLLFDKRVIEGLNKTSEGETSDV